jgi:hypothetical protein
MVACGGRRLFTSIACVLGLSVPACSTPLMPAIPRAEASQPIVPVVVFGRDSRKTVAQFAVEEKSDPTALAHTYAASGLIQCGAAHGAGQLTITDNVITTAAHVFFDEDGHPRAKTCLFKMERDGESISVPVDLTSIVAGSTNPYAIAAVHDWAVARLQHPIDGVTPYALADGQHANMPVEFVARGHVDWGEGHLLSMERCLMHDQLSLGEEGTREFSFDCETGDGASGGAVMTDAAKPTVGAILVGWRSNKPFRSAPYSQTHYNFVVTIEGAFKKAVLAAASPMMVAK